MPKRGHVPIRTCIVCRRTRPKPELLRLALSSDAPSTVVADRDHRLPGRRAYVCPGECLHGLVSNMDFGRKSLSRAFKTSIKNLDFRGLREGNGKNKSL